MCVIVGDFDAFMTDSVCNRRGGKTHIDQEAHMAVADVMNADAGNTCLFGASVHLVMKIALGHGKDSAVRLLSLIHI